ncbi:unnamed protein product, partial [Didymodactylos carnosus]
WVVAFMMRLFKVQFCPWGPWVPKLAPPVDEEFEAG